jgi:SsrA-binding protein
MQASEKIVSKNKKAFHDYHIDQTLEAGIVLSGPEVKSLRAGKGTSGRLCPGGRTARFFSSMFIFHPIPIATHINQEPLRVRKLLLHRREIRKLIGKLHEKGIALIPLKIYFIDLMGRLRWNWAWPVAKNSTTSELLSKRRIPTAKWNEPCGARMTELYRRIHELIETQTVTPNLLLIYGGETDSTGILKLNVACRAFCQLVKMTEPKYNRRRL